MPDVPAWLIACLLFLLIAFVGLLTVKEAWALWRRYRIRHSRPDLRVFEPGEDPPSDEVLKPDPPA